MMSLSSPLSKSINLFQFTTSGITGTVPSPAISCPSTSPNLPATITLNKPLRAAFRTFNRRARYSSDTDDENNDSRVNFNDAIALFNARDFYTCHDVLETLWNDADDPMRTLYHGILQCAVGFHHLFNQNHKGAMMELGEGLCKLRKMEFQTGPFVEFEQDVSAALEFIYKTQLELAACAEDLCIAMDQTERSYQLLGGYAAGQQVYYLELDELNGVMNIVFRPDRSYATVETQLVKLPILNSAEEHLQLQS